MALLLLTAKDNTQ
ncbi:peptidase domain protein [Priestia megaterium WSH-002]|uniref:Peptidase domain protein n=1 Tax=Priestia megaterium (strain WSH-002) TaxID=1006007 RepID=A0A8D4BRE7_PRIMW|nr:peptidase domain protein [Priestia megaterium WSH-002]